MTDRGESSSPAPTAAGKLARQLSPKQRGPFHRRSSSSATSARWDTSRILYPTMQQHPDPPAHPILVLSISELDSVPESIDDEELFETILEKLETWAGEEGQGGYVLVVLAAEPAATDGHSGKGKGRAKPGLGWLLWRWRRIPRRIRKNLKRLYLVHPSSFTRNALPLVLPLLSPKAYAKLFQSSSLFELHRNHGVSLKGIDLPLAVIEEEARLRPKQSPQTAATATWGSSIASALGTMGSYLSFVGLASSASITANTNPRGYWNRTVDDLVDDCQGNTPPILDELRRVILTECITTEGIFRRTPGSHLRPVVVDLLDLPLAQQATLPWTDIARADPLLPPKIVSRILSHCSAPLIKPEHYPLVRQSTTIETIQTVLLPALSTATRLVLTHVISTLHQVSLHAADTRMTSLNLAICIAPDLIKGPDPMEDAGLCMEPGRTLPSQMRGVRPESEGQGEGTLVGLLEIWIREYERFQAMIGSQEEDQVIRSPGGTEHRRGRKHSLLGAAERSKPSSPEIS